MGEAVARILVDLGAEVTGLDIRPCAAQGVATLEVDLRDRQAIVDAAADIDGAVDALFSCAGLPGPPFSELDTILVNFVGARHLAEQLISKMPSGSSINAIASSAAIGWEKQLPTVRDLLATNGFGEAVEWLEANEPSWSWSGYAFSKYALNAWVGWWYPELAARGIRVNATNPGPTDTAMMPAFQDFATKEVVDQAVGPVGRYSTAEEQAWPLVLLGSPRMSYVAGTVLWTDGGWNGALTLGRLDPGWAGHVAG
jgi:NAD(P)-dependent dehydrogenase (short-subunit alcohol dehydrogenase family)